MTFNNNYPNSQNFLCDIHVCAYGKYTHTKHRVFIFVDASVFGAYVCMLGTYKNTGIIAIKVICVYM